MQRNEQRKEMRHNLEWREREGRRWKERVERFKTSKNCLLIGNLILLLGLLAPGAISGQALNLSLLHLVSFGFYSQKGGQFFFGGGSL